MKTIQLTILFLFFPLVFFAQTLTGLWIGSVSNDSMTVRKDQSFEIVLTQYKNKVYGFSRSTFIVNDSLFYIVKRVKGTIEGDVCEVRDDEVVSYNFHGRLDKGVKMVTTFHFDHGDSAWRMDGDWKTNKTKKYYSLSGKATLNQEKDITKSKIFPHLEELKLADDVAFYKESKQVPEPVASTKQPARENKKDDVAKTEKPAIIPPKEIKQTGEDKKAEIAKVDKSALVQPEIKTTDAGQTKQSPAVTSSQPLIKNEGHKVVAVNDDNTNNRPAVQAKTEPTAQTKQPVDNSKTQPTVIEEKKVAGTAKNNKKDNIVSEPKTTSVIQNNQPINDAGKSLAVKVTAPEKEEPKKSEPVAVTKPVEQKKEPAIGTIKPEIKNKEITTVATKEPEKTTQPVSIFQETKPATATAAVFVGERAIAAPQVVNFKSDSLELSLYDNGEVDGDTVSVLLNGELIMAKQGLKVSAIKKTIYVPAGKGDSLTMVLYAENLGKYPPNTGLLIIRDGNDSYQVRFSADLTQNAAVIFKRKKN